MAAPHVTGAAGLLFSLKPTATVTEVRDALLASVDPVASLAGKTVSGGRLDAAAALDAAGPGRRRGRSPRTRQSSARASKARWRVPWPASSSSAPTPTPAPSRQARRRQLRALHQPAVLHGRRRVAHQFQVRREAAERARGRLRRRRLDLDRRRRKARRTGSRTGSGAAHRRGQSARRPARSRSSPARPWRRPRRR